MPRTPSGPKAQNGATWRKTDNPKGFACVEPACTYTSPRKSDVERHHDTHLSKAEKKKKAFSCPVCGRVSLQKSNATTHLRIHTGERNQLCPEPFCGYATTDPSSLNKHRRLKHGHQSNAGTRPSRKRVLEGTDVVVESVPSKKAKKNAGTIQHENDSFSAPSPAASTSTLDSVYPPSSAMSPATMYPSLPESQYAGGSGYGGLPPMNEGVYDIYQPSYDSGPSSYFPTSFDRRIPSYWDASASSEQYHAAAASTSSNFPQSDFTFAYPMQSAVGPYSIAAAPYYETNSQQTLPASGFSFYPPPGAVYAETAPREPLFGMDFILAALRTDIAQIRAERSEASGAGWI
ncbi:hypothetical protein C8F01DRAFT_1254414 [Mycena amicta]|nr:hypothetical protein C8F01DRAFT_1254414 [Mycena amicta]